jgi:hypothetical protein
MEQENSSRISTGRLSPQLVLQMRQEQTERNQAESQSLAERASQVKEKISSSEKSSDSFLDDSYDQVPQKQNTFEIISDNLATTGASAQGTLNQINGQALSRGMTLEQVQGQQDVYQTITVSQARSQLGIAFNNQTQEFYKGISPDKELALQSS